MVYQWPWGTPAMGGAARTIPAVLRARVRESTHTASRTCGPPAGSTLCDPDRGSRCGTERDLRARVHPGAVRPPVAGRGMAAR